MKSRTLLIQLIFILPALTTFCQDRNPFQSIGKKGRILTLTNDRYEEFFDQDSIQQIGSSLVNINTMKLVGLLSDKESKNRLDNTLNSRFLSTDPIANSYPMLSPYQYASNRPIDGTDMDGKEWASETTIGRTSSAIEMHNSFTVRVKVENNSKIVTDPNIIKAKAEVYKNTIESKYKSEATFALYGVAFKVIFDTKVVLDYSPPTSDDGVMGRLVFDDRKSTSTSSVTVNGNVTTTNTLTSSTPGETRGEINQFTTNIGITMDGRVVSDQDLASTDIHEAGHSGSLNHPWKLKDIEASLLSIINQNSPKADEKVIKNNAMNSAENPDSKYRNNGGTNILLGQLFSMLRRIRDKAYFTPEELNAPPKNNAGTTPNNPPTPNQ